MTETPYLPGSIEAVRSGCLCPIIDNCHGKGFRPIPDTFVVSSLCPYHGRLVDAPDFWPLVFMTMVILVAALAADFAYHMGWLSDLIAELRS